MAMLVGKGVKMNKVEKQLAKFPETLLPGEEVWFWAKCNNFKPSVDAVVITNARVIGFSTITGTKFVTTFAEIAGTEANEKKGSYQVDTTSGASIAFKSVPGEDVPTIEHYVAHGRSAPMPEIVQSALSAKADEEAATAQATSLQKQREAQAKAVSWPNSKMVGSAVSSKASQAILQQCHGDEQPWLILGSGTAGVLAAFDDRLAIIKTGAMTGMLAGSMGGGRSGTFHFRDITGIEHNSGMINGVLEILTPSYTGTSTHDFWGSGDKDPFKLNNCLPLAKSEYRQVESDIQELRSRVSQAKQPHVVQAAPAPSASSLADEMRKLAELRDAGILSEDEFAAAKARLIAG